MRGRKQQFTKSGGSRLRQKPARKSKNHFLSIFTGKSTIHNSAFNKRPDSGSTMRPLKRASMHKSQYPLQSAQNTGRRNQKNQGKNKGSVIFQINLNYNKQFNPIKNAIGINIRSKQGPTTR